jgi:hypothetical protein
MTVQIPIGAGASIAGQFANRHGLIAGATGTGKSVTLMTLAEGFSRAGVPVFLADVKGDLGRIAATCPVHRLDAFGRTGERLSIRMDSLGPDIAARVLGLSEVQAATLEVAFAVTRSNRWPLAATADLRRVLEFMVQQHRAISQRFGRVSPASVAVIQRALIGLQRDGSGELFGARTYDVAALLARSPDGRGLVTLLDATRLYGTAAYGAALLYLMTDLFERLPEVGDLDAPRLVLFLDEAHLLFVDIAPGLLQRVERVVRLIRSKGVGLYFASQSPADIPPVILGQLGNRIQHGLRGATLADLRAIRATAETLPINPKIDAAAAILTLGVGQALVSTVGPDGIPRPVALVRVRAPDCLTAEAPADHPPMVAPAPAMAMPTRNRAQEARGLLIMLAASGLAALALVEAARAFLGL